MKQSSILYFTTSVVNLFGCDACGNGAGSGAGGAGSGDVTNDHVICDCLCYIWDSVSLLPFILQVS